MAKNSYKSLAASIGQLDSDDYLSRCVETCLVFNSSNDIGLVYTLSIEIFLLKN